MTTTTHRLDDEAAHQPRNERAGVTRRLMRRLPKSVTRIRTTDDVGSRRTRRLIERKSVRLVRQQEVLVAELIRRQSARTNTAVESALTHKPARTEVLVGIAANLLNVLLSDTSLALNRAAMSSPALAAILLQHGRHTTGPLVERYLARLHREGLMQMEDPAEAFRLFYGLTIQDSQIRALLGEPPPNTAERAKWLGRPGAGHHASRSA